jgi:thioesterase domain-containing protein
MIRTLRAGDGPAFVCIHPTDGQVDHYRALAASLTWPGPILGIEAEPGTRSLDELAVRYADALEPHQPSVLLGWVLGGVVAAELARVLVERGHPIARLAVLDARVPQPEMRARPTDRDTLARFFVYQRAMMAERTPGPAPQSTDAATLLAALQAAGTAGDIADANELERRLVIFMELNRAFLAHEQRPVPIAIDLFEAADAAPSHPKPPTLGWDGLAPRVVHHTTSGTHFTLLAANRCVELSAKLSTL